SVVPSLLERVCVRTVGTNTHARARARTHAHTYACTHARTHTRTHTHTHTQSESGADRSTVASMAASPLVFLPLLLHNQHEWHPSPPPSPSPSPLFVCSEAKRMPMLHDKAYNPLES